MTEKEAELLKVLKDIDPSITEDNYLDLTLSIVKEYPNVVTKLKTAEQVIRSYRSVIQEMSKSLLG